MVKQAIAMWLAVGSLAFSAGCDGGKDDSGGDGNAGGKTDEIGETDQGGTTDPSSTTDPGDTDIGETDIGDTDQADELDVNDPAWVAFLAAASDVEQRIVAIPDTPRPTGFNDENPRTASGYFLNGPEFWERWTGGDTKEFNEDNASDDGLKCAIAAAKRWEVLHAAPPPEFADMRANHNWEGSYFNWIEDVSEGGSISFDTGWWAWRTHTMKFISVVHPDGTCELPTLELMRTAGEVCGARGDANQGKTEGCRARFAD